MTFPRMPRNWRTLALGPILLGSWVQVPVSGQVLSEAMTAHPILSVGPGARAAGMGECFTAVADDLSALYFNPAGLSYLKESEVSFMHNGGLAGGFSETVAMGFAVKEVGHLAFSAHVMDYGAIEKRDILGILQGTYSPIDFGFRAGFGFPLEKDLRLGVASHWIRQDLDGSIAAGLSWDLGLLVTQEDGLRFGISMRNLGLETKGGEMPTEVTMGGGFRTPFGEQGEHLVLLAFSGGYTRQGIGRLGVGGEYSYRKEYFLRAGFARHLVEDPQEGVKGLSLGAGIHMGQADLDYAMSFLGELGSLHKISLTLAFAGISGTSPAQPSSPALVPNPDPSLGLTPVPFGPEGEKKPVFMKFQVSSEADLTAVQLLEKGEEKWRLGLKQEALDLFIKALEKDPDLDRAWELLGRTYLDKSLEAYRKVLEKHPENERLRRWLDLHQKK